VSHIGTAASVGQAAPIRLYLYHPYNLALIGLRSVLTAAPHIEVVGEGGSRRLLARRVREHRADVAVLGLSRDAQHAELDIVRALRVVGGGVEPHPAPRVIVLSQDHEPDTVLAAVRAGAQAFLSLDVSARELEDAVRVVAAGGAVLCPCGAKAMIDAYTGNRAPPAQPAVAEELSRRERQVLQLLAEGNSSADMAVVLSVTEATVRSHIHHLLGKLGLSSRAQAIAYAFQHGLVPSVPSPTQSLDHLGHAAHRRRVEHDLQRHLHA
jgi:DNA-binding NarL/FixJ family response regulator